MWWIGFVLGAIFCFGIFLFNLIYLHSFTSIESSLFGVGFMCLLRHFEELKRNKKYSFMWKYHGRH